MRKFTLLILAVMAGMGTASADVELYLHNSNNNWGAYPAFVNKGTNPANSSETIYEYVLNSTSGLGESDFYFRLKWSDYNDDIRPYGSKDYEFVYNDGVSGQNGGQWETYTLRHSEDIWGSTGAFKIAQSTIKASEYKITVYANRGSVYYLKVEIVSKPATVSSLGYATFSCDRALDFTSVTGLTAYKASVNNEAKVVLTKVDGKVAAGTGLLLAGNSADIPVVPTAEGVAITDNLLKGCTTEQTIAASGNGVYHYFLAGTDAETLGFYNLASAATCAAGKAYLETTTALANETGSARVAWIFQDDATAINAVENAQNAEIVYDLQGRVAKTAKAGLYIKNGKKFIVK